MNTIFWKGVLSTTIEGLLISELPPISKPPLRVKETTIDGRDGSTIEELGYSSYEKSITIGLHGSFNINKVIKYFTGEGEIIFSNEPDKVYTAKIVGQIDYNRLLRFRTAVVKFRVQPFKHKYNEAYKEAPTTTAIGTSIVANDSAEANLKAFSIYGKTTQDGTPTPDAPVELVSVGDGGSLTIHVCGKNLFTGWSVGGIRPDTGEDYAVDTQRRTGYIPIIASGQKHRISKIPNTLYSFVAFYDADKVFINRTAATQRGSMLVEPPSNATYFRLAIYENVEAPGTITEADDMASFTMIEVGDTATEHEPIKAIQTVTISTNGLHGIPVSSGGNYTDANGQQWICDEIDLARGVYVKRINIVGLENALGVREFRSASNDTYRFSFQLGYNPTFLPSAGVIGMCNALTYNTSPIGFNSIDNAIYAYELGGIYVRCDAFETVDDFLAWAKNIGLKVQYILAKPIETPLSAEELAIYSKLHTNEPNTTVQNDANAYMKVEYFKPFEVFNEGLENSKPIMVLHGSGSVGISVNGVHIFDYTFPDGETEVVIDSEKQDAYLGDVLKNRNMNGEFPVLLAGTNKIEWSGDVESIEILPRSRWL